MATAHSHPFMKEFFHGENVYVWPDASGKQSGQIIEPFYPTQSKAAKVDPIFYKLLALVDVIRVGRVREVDVAMTELKNTIAQ